MYTISDNTSLIIEESKRDSMQDIAWVHNSVLKK